MCGCLNSINRFCCEGGSGVSGISLLCPDEASLRYRWGWISVERAYSHRRALRNCNVKKTRRELSRWELRNRATRADTLSKRAVHVQPPQLSTACLRRPQHELREQRQHCTSSSTQIEPSMWAMTSTAVNACGVVLRRIGHRGRPCSWRGGGGGVKPLF